MSPLVAGVDCSTQASKVLVVDSTPVRSCPWARAARRVGERRGARDGSRAVVEALGIALSETGRAGEVDAISVAGQQRGLVVTGSDGRPLRPAILWNDTRSAAQAAELRSPWAGPTGGPSTSGCGARAFLHRHPLGLAARARARRAAAAAAAVRLPHDFITERLCGRAVTDRGDASGTAWWSTRDELLRRGARARGADRLAAPRGARTG